MLRTEHTFANEVRGVLFRTRAEVCTGVQQPLGNERNGCDNEKHIKQISNPRRTRGPVDQRTAGDQRTRGPADQGTSGPEDRPPTRLGIPMDFIAQRIFFIDSVNIYFVDSVTIFYIFS